MSNPVIQTTFSAGADIKASKGVTIPPKGSAVVSTGYTYHIPKTSFVRGRSGLAFKHNVIAFEGTIDADYVGNEVKVKLFNLGDKPYVVEKGDRIAQLVVVEAETDRYFEVVDRIRHSGFGSTNDGEEEG